MGASNLDDLYVSLGRGDIKLAQIMNRLQPTIPKLTRPVPRPLQFREKIVIEGVGHLLTHFAKCCDPKPGDQIIGFMTLGRGVSIHKKQCQHVLHAPAAQQERFLQASWGAQTPAQKKLFNLVIEAYDRSDLLKDLTQIMAKYQIRILSLQTRVAEKTGINHLRLNLEAEDHHQHLEGLKNALEGLVGMINIKQILL